MQRNAEKFREMQRDSEERNSKKCRNMQINVGKEEKCREMQKTSEKWIEMQDDVGRYENSQRSENSFKKGIWGNRL